MNFDLGKYLDLHGGGANTVFGVDCTSFGHADFMFLDFLLYHHSNITNVVELGTQYGATALYLGMAMRLRGGNVTTFDIGDFRHPSAVMGWLPNVEFVKEDVLTPNEKVISRLSNGNTLLLCDNGNKEKEVEMYAQYLESKSVLLVHDWITEVRPDVIDPYLTRYVPFEHHISEKMNSYLRAWERM